MFLSFDKCQGMPATLMTEIKRTIAVVDSSLFGNDWIDSRKALKKQNFWRVRNIIVPTLEI